MDIWDAEKEEEKARRYDMKIEKEKATKQDMKQGMKQEINSRNIEITKNLLKNNVI